MKTLIVCGECGATVEMCDHYGSRLAEQNRLMQEKAEVVSRALSLRIATLEVAMRPFADIVEKLEKIPGLPDTASVELTMGDLRRARRAVLETPPNAPL